MGHVDHGKTSLLDAIREANVAGSEAGGITQHIGAYHVEKNGRKIVFIDTPGHEAFTRMRARGAKVTDIVVLVVAADDGVMPQTLEAIDHARAAKVPIIVAINKIDKPDAQPERIKQQLADRGLLAEDWGGETVMVPVSAKTQDQPGSAARNDSAGGRSAGSESQSRAVPPWARCSKPSSIAAAARWPPCWCATARCTWAIIFICGAVFGKVRAMLNDRGEQIREAEPSTPVEVLGLESLPEAGDDFQVVTDTAKAKQIVNLPRSARLREAALAKTSRLTLEQLHKQMEAGEVKELPIIIKTDVGGSAEVLTETLQKLSNEKVKMRVIHSGVGAINESDVLLASASNAIIIGFNVRPERNAAALAEQEKVDVRLHTIIYNLDRRDQARHDRPAGAGLQGSLQGQGRGARDVPHHQGRQRGRLHGAGWHHHARQPKSGCCATTWWFIPARSARCAASRTTSSEVKTGYGVRHHARELRRRQAGRHHRGLRHGARGAPKSSPERPWPRSVF